MDRISPSKDPGPLRRYWIRYGGWSAVIKSSYFKGSFAVVVVLSPIWSEPEWWSTVIGVIPSMLGFSLGGFAMLLAFGNDKFLDLIARKRELTKENQKVATSLFMDTCAAFVHFIAVQIAALGFALLAEAWNGPAPGFLISLFDMLGIGEGLFCKASRIVGWGFCYLVFIYAIACALAATVRIFVLAELFEKFSNLQNQTNSDRTTDTTSKS